MDSPLKQGESQGFVSCDPSSGPPHKAIHLMRSVQTWPDLTRDRVLANGLAHMGQVGQLLSRCTTTCYGDSIELRTEKIRPMVSEIEFLANGPAHMGRMGELISRCTTRPLDDSIELRTEKICPKVSEIAFLANGPAHMGRIGELISRCTTRR